MDYERLTFRGLQVLALLSLVATFLIIAEAMTCSGIFCAIVIIFAIPGLILAAALWLGSYKISAIVGNLQRAKTGIERRYHLSRILYAVLFFVSALMLFAAGHYMNTASSTNYTRLLTLGLFLAGAASVTWYVSLILKNHVKNLAT